MKPPAEQLQKMGFTTPSGSTRSNSCDIFEPGPSRLLSSNMSSMIFCGNSNPDGQDNTPAKKRGLLEDGNMSSPVAGGSGKFASSKPTDVVIFVKPVNVSLLPRIFYTTPQYRLANGAS